MAVPVAYRVGHRAPCQGPDPQLGKPAIAVAECPRGIGMPGHVRCDSEPDLGRIVGAVPAVNLERRDLAGLHRQRPHKLTPGGDHGDVVGPQAPGPVPYQTAQHPTRNGHRVGQHPHLIDRRVRRGQLHPEPPIVASHPVVIETHRVRSRRQSRAFARCVRFLLPA